MEQSLLLVLEQGEKRRFAMLGNNGQPVFVEPGSEIVLVHAGDVRNINNVFRGDSTMREIAALWNSAVIGERSQIKAAQHAGQL